MGKKIIVVLSNEAQYESFVARFPEHKDITVLCDDLSFCDFLNTKGISFEVVREKDIRDKWEEVNTWACEKALFWGGVVSKKCFFENMEMDNALYVYFSYYLVAVLKNYLLADYIFNRYDFSEIIIFQDGKRRDFPGFCGNYFLNKFMTEIAGEKGINLIKIQESKIQEFEQRLSWKEKVRNFVKKVYVAMCGHNIKFDGILFSGALSHLFPFMEELVKMKKELVFFDRDFQFKNLLFCLKRKIKYLLPEMFLNKDSENAEVKEQLCLSVKNIFQDLKKVEWFKYEGKDFSGFLSEEIAEASMNYVLTMSEDFVVYSEIISQNNIKSVVVNEDLMPKNAFMAAFFKSKNIKVNCISHAYQPINFNISFSDKKFDLSETFVHSEYEKDLYEKWGWNRELIKVTGIPRYDRLMDIKLNSLHREEDKKSKRFLFCGAWMQDVTPDSEYYMGVFQNETGAHSRVCLDKLISALMEYDVELVIKPHYIIDEMLWKNFISKYVEKEMKLKITLVPAKSDFFDLLGMCDAMFLGHWSTAIIESVVMGVPVIVLNYSGLEDGHPFASNGLCSVARDEEQLKFSIEAVIGAGGKNILSRVLLKNEDLIYYTGINDGKATERVLQSIISSD